MNVWQHDVGRYGATNMGVLKTVLKVNLELFHSAADSAQSPPPRTTILFVVRDFDNETPLQFLERTLMEDVTKIWNEMKKPTGFEHIPLSKLFEFKSVGLAKATAAATKNQFVQDVNELREKISNFWLPVKYSRNIPADGFSVYMQSIWSAILQSTDLDIPSQRRLLAEFRCEEIRLQVIQKHAGRFDQLRQEASEGEAVDVGNRVNDIVGDALEQFDLVAVRYDPIEVYHEKRVTLIKQLFNEAQRGILAHFNHVRARLSNEAKTELESEVAKRRQDGTLDSKLLLWTDLLDILRNWAFKYDESFTTQLDDAALVIPPPADASAAIAPSKELFELDSLQSALRESLESIAGVVTAEEKSLARQALHKEVGTSLNKETLDDILNADAKASKVAVWTNIGVHVKQTRMSMLSMFESTWEGLEFETPLSEAISMSMLAALRSWSEAVSSTLEARIVDRFRNSFQRDDTGIPRHWPKMTAEEVTEIFVKSQSRALELIDIVEQISLPPSVFADVPSQNLLSDLTKKVVESAKKQNIVNKANSAMEQICRDALVLQATGGAPVNIPLWLWGVLLVLGWNELMAVITSPFTFILLLIAASIGAIAFYSGNKSLPFVVAKQGLQMAFTVVKPMLSQLDRALQHQPDLSAAATQKKQEKASINKQD